MIKEAIEKAGYKALKATPTSAADEDRACKRKELRTLRRKYMVTAALGLPLLYIAMASMISAVRLLAAPEKAPA